MLQLYKKRHAIVLWKTHIVGESRRAKNAHNEADIICLRSKSRQWKVAIYWSSRNTPAHPNQLTCTFTKCNFDHELLFLSHHPEAVKTCSSPPCRSCCLREFLQLQHSLQMRLHLIWVDCRADGETMRLALPWLDNCPCVSMIFATRYLKEHGAESEHHCSHNSQVGRWLIRLGRVNVSMDLLWTPWISRQLQGSLTQSG